MSGSEPAKKTGLSASEPAKKTSCEPVGWRVTQLIQDPTSFAVHRLGHVVVVEASHVSRPVYHPVDTQLDTLDRAAIRDD